MGSNHLQLGKKVQNFSQLQGMGVVITAIAHMKQDGQFSLYRFVKGENPGIINGEPLRIRVHFNAVQPHIYNPLRFIHQSVHFCVDCAEGDKTIVAAGLCLYKIVDFPHPIRSNGYG